MDRVLDREAGLAVADLHRDHGVDVRLGVGVEGFDERRLQRRVGRRRWRTAPRSGPTSSWSGSGSPPMTELAGRLRPDARRRRRHRRHLLWPPPVSSPPATWLAGPTARFGGRLMRVEQWDNAVDMGMPRRAPTAGHPGRRGPHRWCGRWRARPAVRPGSLVLERPVRPQDPAGRCRRPPTMPRWSRGRWTSSRFVQIYGDERRPSSVGALCWNRPRQAIHGPPAGGRAAESLDDRPPSDLA